MNNTEIETKLVNRIESEIISRFLEWRQPAALGVFELVAYNCKVPMEHCKKMASKVLRQLLNLGIIGYRKTIYGAEWYLINSDLAKDRLKVVIAGNSR